MLFNSVFGIKLMKKLGLQMVNRNYFDPQRNINIPQHKIDVWPGYQFAIHPTECGYTLNVDVVSKIMRVSTVLDMLMEYRRSSNDKQLADENVVGKVVLTRFNNMTYRVEAIDWTKTPQDKFVMKKKAGELISFVDYFKEHYSREIQDLNQPMLVVKGKKGSDTKILLPPELCCPTGLTDEMRNNGALMKDLAQYTRINPSDRMRRVHDFVSSLQSKAEAKAELDRWGMQVVPNFVEVRGRVLPPAQVVINEHATVTIDPGKAEFGRDIYKTINILDPCNVERWVLIASSRDRPVAEEFLRALKQAAQGFGIRLADPLVVPLESVSGGDADSTYSAACTEKVPEGAQLIVGIMGQNGVHNGYRGLKRICALHRGIPSQVVLARTLQKKNMLLSICSKIILQINCKLGKPLYHVPMPKALTAAPTMVVGIDVNHTNKRTRASVAAVCATMDHRFSKYHSLVSYQSAGQELVVNLQRMIEQCAKRFHAVNGICPANIVVYRDGVSEDELRSVVEMELPNLRNINAAVDPSAAPANVAVMVVQKRVHARFAVAQGQALSNPRPGTIVDRDVTSNTRADFYMVAQHVNQGTTTPTHYQLVFNSTAFGPDDMQLLTHRLCFMYFNWPGAIRVPAPVMYAHKLAFLVGTALLKGGDGKMPHMNLSDSLYYL
eukprot:TRINITY_DN5498_c0_g1_i1.p2 TRINITY_DN5498_c0_g1~~TRINITY_DN5498_c0_g1_i1.p2  ORF type:complete len:665 (-),score=178.92 TRINITY_DN5498_c0_g1_i1:723-2717(-)